MGAIDDAHSAFGDLREDTVAAEHAADHQNDVITLLRTCLAVMFGLARFRRDVGAVRIQARTCQWEHKTGQEPEGETADCRPTGSSHCCARLARSSELGA